MSNDLMTESESDTRLRNLISVVFNIWYPKTYFSDYFLLLIFTIEIASLHIPTHNTYMTSYRSYHFGIDTDHSAYVICLVSFSYFGRLLRL